MQGPKTAPKRLTGTSVSLALALASSVGCGPTTGQASSPSANYPVYADASKRLFGDTIDPAAVGLDMDRRPISLRDSILGDRIQAATWVGSVRVSTVSARDRADRGEHFDVTLRIVERLTGKLPGEDSIVVQIDPMNDSYGIVKSFGERLVGKPFVGFFRNHRGPEGSAVVHFHLAPDTPELQAAIRGAALLNELR